MSLTQKLTVKAEQNKLVLKGGKGSGNWGHGGVPGKRVGSISGAVTGAKGKEILDKAREARAGVKAYEGLDEQFLKDAVYYTNSNREISAHLENAGFTKSETKKTILDAIKNSPAVDALKKSAEKYPKIATGTGALSRGNFSKSYYRISKDTIGVLTQNKDNYGRLQSVEVSHLTK